MVQERPIRVLHVLTVPLSLLFFRGQTAYMKGRGFDLVMLSAPGPELDRFAAEEQVATHAVEMERRITVWADVRAVRGIVGFMARLRPDIVHSHTPKGGLLGMIAAAFVGVPVRIYHMRGLPFLGASGWKRRLLLMTERVACRLAHRVLSVSHSNRAVALEFGLCPPEKIKVLLGGSSNGVDAGGRFNPDALPPTGRVATRARYGLPQDALVVGFIGRVVRDKGVVELAEAWQAVRARFPDAWLLVVGPFEAQDPLPEDVTARLEADPRVVLVGLDWDTPPLYAAMDVFVLPTYREGFPNVLLEAASMRLPIVATRVSGCTDAVIDGKTGTLVPLQDADALADALAAYLGDPALRAAHGRAARARVEAEFQREAIWSALEAEYQTLLLARGLPLPLPAADLPPLPAAVALPPASHLHADGLPAQTSA